MSDFQAHAICIRITRSLRILPHSVAQACPFMIKHMICYMLRSFATFDEKVRMGLKVEIFYTRKSLNVWK